MTNLELLRVTLDAVNAAAKVMQDYLNDCDRREPDEEQVETHNLREMRKTREISGRSCNSLLRAGFKTLEYVVDRIESPKQLQKIRNMGPRSVCEVLNLADNYGLKWKWETAEQEVKHHGQNQSST